MTISDNFGSDNFGSDNSGSDNVPSDTGPDMTVDPKLLEILVCPLTKSPLEYDRQRQELISTQAGLAYPIRDGIPIMLPDEARELDDDVPGMANG